MDALQVLTILLDAASPEAEAPRMVVMKVQRADEFAALHRLPTDVPVVVDARYANATVTSKAIQAMHGGLCPTVKSGTLLVSWATILMACGLCLAHLDPMSDWCATGYMISSLWHCTTASQQMLQPS